MPCLVLLIRQANGLRPWQELIEALRSHPPGIEHELVLAMKGFTYAGEARPYLDQVRDLKPKTLFFADRGFDLGVFFAAATRLRRDRYCFVNSNGRPLVDGWLAKLDAALDLPGVGQTGPFGSWASMHSWLMYTTGLPSAYSGLLPPRRVLRARLASLGTEAGSGKRGSAARSIGMRLKTLPNVPHELLRFEPFPTPHLRTSVFMITHAALKEMLLPIVRTKMQTFEIESGRNSVTRQLERLGLVSLVVDRSGTVHGPEQWPRSHTFMQGDQEELLMADNHVIRYALGDVDYRNILSSCTWGSQAEARPSRGGSGDVARS